MNRMSIENRAKILSLLVEGNSLRSTSRIADCSINTVTKLLVEVGEACAKFQDENLRNLPSTRIECDEVWSFCYAKDKNLPEDKKEEFGFGDIWTWTAICPDTKLIACWLVGGRDQGAANAFMADLAPRLANRIQLTTDGYSRYLEAVEKAFNGNIDYAMLVKSYNNNPKTPERKYSPASFKSATKRKICGSPVKELVSTSMVERQNLTMRMSMRRFTRLTNAFSKKIDNHMHAIALHFMYYNFGRIHKTLRVTPAMEAGIASKVWTLEDIAALVVEPESKPRGPYKKKA